ncbi:LysM peptidoglycan-binding domain-containing protein [Mycobacterium simiae]|uniref:LysM peptidoglycan-binding domain-containing protein n=1 Tax=Mycobacterium simiae TaxID=1784 RepID=A0A5B1BWB2_MYCSI|nr:LysM peptidoglycan-binding domain-containing protein [Mycobacterium simiae]KAA1251449.1 LysM peptidoglycan-binding domain-containing protein [Mycobacterium simiae]
MTLMQAIPPRTCRSVRGPVNGPVPASVPSQGKLASARRPGPSRPVGAPLRYRGTGVAISRAPHRRRPVPLATTVGLALLAGLVTFWLGLVAHFGAMVSGGFADSPAPVPDKLAVVRVEAGESLSDVAARVAPDAPVKQVVDRIRELNALDSSSPAAGQTLIAPVG